MTTPSRRRRKKIKPRTKQILVSFIMGMLVGIVLALTMRPMPAPVAYVQVPEQTAVVNKAYTVATPPEDSPAWSCKTMGNHICGPGNPEKAKPGLYNHNRRVVTWDDLKAWGIVR